MEAAVGAGVMRGAGDVKIHVKLVKKDKCRGQLHCDRWITKLNIPYGRNGDVHAD